MTIHKFIPQNIKLDKIQSSVADILENVAIFLNSKPHFPRFISFLNYKTMSFVFNHFNKIKYKNTSFNDRAQRAQTFISNASFEMNDSIKGVYLHGGVGRGKTMLMKSFFERINTWKEVIHYQNFMQEIHTKLHKLQNKYPNRVIEELATDIANRANVICLDEFEIKDITDAMLIMRLTEQLVRRHVFIFLTTNTIPQNLYKDGIQRESFLPFINMIQEKFLVLHLDSNTDYRFANIAEVGRRILYPLNAENKAEIQKIKKELCCDAPLFPGIIEVFGRKIIFAKTRKQVLFTDFNELFQRDMGYVDYVNICQYFQVIVLEDVQEIKEDESDIITRFINFIDNAYFYKVLLFITLDRAPEEIYKKGRKIEEFKRTISRLNEINSTKYLEFEKQNEL